MESFAAMSASPPPEGNELLAFHYLLHHFYTRWKVKYLFNTMGCYAMKIQKLTQGKNKGKRGWVFVSDSLKDEDFEAQLPSVPCPNNGKRSVPFFIDLCPTLPVKPCTIHSFIYRLNQMTGYVFLNDQCFLERQRFVDMKGCFFGAWCVVGFVKPFYDDFMGVEEFVAFLENGKLVFGSTMDILFASDRATLAKFFKEFPFITLPMNHEEDDLAFPPPFPPDQRPVPPPWIFNNDPNQDSDFEVPEILDNMKRKRIEKTQRFAAWIKRASPETPTAFNDHLFSFVSSDEDEA